MPRPLDRWAGVQELAALEAEDLRGRAHVDQDRPCAAVIRARPRRWPSARRGSSITVVKASSVPGDGGAQSTRSVVTPWVSSASASSSAPAVTTCCGRVVQAHRCSLRRARRPRGRRPRWRRARSLRRRRAGAPCRRSPAGRRGFRSRRSTTGFGGRRDRRRRARRPGRGARHDRAPGPAGRRRTRRSPTPCRAARAAGSASIIGCGRPTRQLVVAEVDERVPVRARPGRGPVDRRAGCWTRPVPSASAAITIASSHRVPPENSPRRCPPGWPWGECPGPVLVGAAQSRLSAITTSRAAAVRSG